MNLTNILRASAIGAAIILAGAGSAKAADLPLIDFNAVGVETRLTPNSTEGSALKIVDGTTGKVLEVACTAGAHGSPGVAIKPDGAVWDLSKYGEVDADITNISADPISIFIRVDNPGDWHTSPWDMDRISIAAGKTGTVKAIFGYSWGNVGYAIDPTKISQLLLFAGKLKQDATFHVDRVYAKGAPGEKPAGMVEKIKPLNGVMVDFSPPFTPTDMVSLASTAALTGAGAAKGAQVTFTAGTETKPSGVTFKAPGGGIWDLSDSNQVEFTVTNPGGQPVHVYGRVENPWPTNSNNSVIGDSVVPAGATKTFIASFLLTSQNDPDDKTTGSHFTSDHVTGVSVLSDAVGAGQSVIVRKVVASVAPPPTMPDWLGQRPPVAGNWTKTLEDNFDGSAINTNLWVLPDKPSASIWDSGSVNLPQNAYVANGMLYLKVDKPAAAPSYDDATLNSRKYTTSMVTTFDKFAQRYGYFEARMKLPTTLGMWPAFWLMPDRGKDAGIWWKRQDTKNGGMEFDIMEYLTRFGPYRYNVAMHWDGYAKLHKATGGELNYFQPDKDGFVTAGLLWAPGEVTYFANGHPVLHWKNDRIGITPEYIIFTMPIGGWGTNGYVDDSKLPATFQVDYVRVWQRDDWKNLPLYDMNAPVPVPTPAVAPAK